MPNDYDKSSIGERLTGTRDPKDPDGLLTVDQAEDPPSRTAYGTEETDTSAVEELQADKGETHVPPQNGITKSDTIR